MQRSHLGWVRGMHFKLVAREYDYPLAWSHTDLCYVSRVKVTPSVRRSWKGNQAESLSSRSPETMANSLWSQERTVWESLRQRL